MTLTIDDPANRSTVRTPDAKTLAQKMTELKAVAKEKGYFDVAPTEKILRVAELVLMPAIAFTLLSQGGYLAILGAFVLGVHYPRAGYLAHDVAHNHWGPRNEPLAQWMFNLIALTVGFGPTWWVEKHEIHHAFPNGCRNSPDGTLTPIDGDIDNVPWLVWDASLAEYNQQSRRSLLHKAVALVLPRFQVPLFFPMLSLSRFNWSGQSVVVAWDRGTKREAVLCAAHWVLGFTLAGMLSPGPAWVGWLWFISAQLIGGLILACVFVMNHTGMEVYDAGEVGGFYDRQARSTRNTTTSAFFDWMTGGLNSQIEHHMFPTMARRNLPKMRAATRQAMEECGYVYEEVGNRDAMTAVLEALGKAAKAC